MKKEGLFGHLQTCHLEIDTIKTKTLIQFLSKLMSHSKNNQVEEIIELWRGQPAAYITKCHFEDIINLDQTLRESLFKMLQIYL